MRIFNYKSVVKLLLLAVGHGFSISKCVLHPRLGKFVVKVIRLGSRMPGHLFASR